MPPLTTERIGKYRILSQISQGGMAELFLAFTAGPGGFRKYVAVKRILPEAKSNEQFVKMFLDEARITAAFTHPNIAQVFELGEEPEGLYLAMEFVSGQDLNQITRACARARAVLPIGFSLSVVREVCAALHYAHTFAGSGGQVGTVIHRDVAQKNVMVSYEGAVKLLDFGIAKAKNSLVLTRNGTVKGTAGYMSPEQVRGESLDPRSDLFSLGVMLHELITGRRLFAGETDLDEMQKILHDPIPNPSDVEPLVPPELSRVVMHALARDRALRYPNARELLRDLDALGTDWHFDQEQRAAFINTLFAEQRAAARELLETAARTPSPAPRLLPKDGQPPSPAAGAATGVDLPAVDSEVAEPEPRLTSPWPLRVALALAVAIGVGATLRAVFPSADEEASPTEAESFPQPVPKPSTATVPPLPTGSPQDSPSPAPSPLKGSKRTGTLTLITAPEAAVSLSGVKKKSESRLGKTPLFSVALPAGVHLLTLEGPDGRRWKLSVPISVGKNTALKLRLEELPPGGP